jgi:hypothetical protein
MPSVMFRCPNTGYRVQGWFADDVSEDGDNTYRSLTCIACQGVHLVSLRGKVLGISDESSQEPPVTLCAIAKMEQPSVSEDVRSS